jgi:hypothetical protein
MGILIRALLMHGWRDTSYMQVYTDILQEYEEGQTTLWPKEKGQKDKQRSTKHTHKTKDRLT